jgi:hypothetical protein
MKHDDAINAALLVLAEAFKSNMTRGRGVPDDFEAQMAHAPRVILDAIQNNQTDQLGVQHELVMLPAPVLIQLVADALRAPVLSDHLHQSKTEMNGWVTGWKNYRKPIRERQRKKAQLDRKASPESIEAFRANWLSMNPGRTRGLQKAIQLEFGIKDVRTINRKRMKTE